MSHRESANFKVAHAEAALGAGRPYEKAQRGQPEMYDSMKELEEQHAKQYSHGPSHESRGQRIDKELEQEDKETIKKMDQAYNQRHNEQQQQH
ncbi:uncharacterized protein BX663DRAFT_504278 [Cokeromyces recurvatus]|uniref:uncharacterized protein n=1 Tax=Cokeromyces recurvatus TaxID=90255 RepID=UPI00221F9F87|nr:uncharacterized protein BX663DRAFT_504278 [Cokeromyces recurvatus]KAI7904202.1 hypothetical protein BX663DRAFT_504278 [Cokeromyces recurvatus]